jgi:hypothetical protein
MDFKNNHLVKGCWGDLEGAVHEPHKHHHQDARVTLCFLCNILSMHVCMYESTNSWISVCVPWPNLTLDMASQTEQKSMHP